MHSLFIPISDSINNSFDVDGYLLEQGQCVNNDMHIIMECKCTLFTIPHSQHLPNKKLFGGRRRRRSGSSAFSFHCNAIFFASFDVYWLDLLPSITRFCCIAWTHSSLNIFKKLVRIKTLWSNRFNFLWIIIICIYDLFDDSVMVPILVNKIV